ncbi:MAG: twin-arginine translocase TatA/TatE family subunit [Patescibacteria group bacterium]|nr:twin-arginine translocase TatA/TatE family subunit [Patescibacteria group bacterium]
MFGLGTEELILILIIVLVLFGATKLPQLAKGIGQSIRELRKGLSDDPHAKAEDKKEHQGDAEKKA